MVIVLAMLAPVGMLVPALLSAGGAWGEWGGHELGAQVGYIPRGFARLAQIWRAPLADYALPANATHGLRASSFEYALSAVIGVAAVAAGMALLGWLLTRKKRRQ